MQAERALVLPDAESELQPVPKGRLHFYSNLNVPGAVASESVPLAVGRAPGRAGRRRDAPAAARRAQARAPRAWPPHAQWRLMGLWPAVMPVARAVRRRPGGRESSMGMAHAGRQVHHPSPPRLSAQSPAVPLDMHARGKRRIATAIAVLLLHCQ